MRVETSAENVRKLSLDDISRVLRLIVEVAESRRLNPGLVIDQILELMQPAGPAQGRLDRATAEFVDRMRRIRLKRNVILGADLFRDAAWDMLLELFAAHHQSRELSVSSICYSSGVPLTTAIRQLKRLEDAGLVRREDGGKDNRAQIVRPTNRAIDLVRMVTAELIDNFLAVQRQWSLVS